MRSRSAKKESTFNKMACSEKAWLCDRRESVCYFLIVADLNEVVQLVTRTPCALVKGAIEVRLITEINDAGRARIG